MDSSDDGWPNDPDPPTDESDSLTEDSESLIDDSDDDFDLGYVVPKWCTINVSDSTTEKNAHEEFQAVGVSDKASQFRDAILANATKIVKALPKRRNVRSSTGTTRRKRPAPAESNSLEPGQDGDGQPAVTVTRPPAKKSRTTKTAADAPLSNVSTSKLNALRPARAPRAKFTATRTTKSRAAPAKTSKSRETAIANNHNIEPHITTSSVSTPAHKPKSSNPTGVKAANMAAPPDKQKLPASQTSFDEFDLIDDDDAIFDLLQDPSSSLVTDQKGQTGTESTSIERAPSVHLRPKQHSTEASRPSSSMSTPKSTPIAEESPPKPFIRPSLSAEPFPQLTAVPSLTDSNRIPTCFRIAEAMRLISSVPKPGSMTIELYAWCIIFQETEKKWSIKLADLFFPDKPPYITRYSCIHPLTGQKQATASNGDMLAKKMCRLLIKATNTDNSVEPHPNTPASSASSQTLPASSPTKSESKQPKIPIASRLDILKWDDTTWDQVRYVRGIVDPEHQVLNEETGLMGTDTR
jgi:hypothetical protein